MHHHKTVEVVDAERAPTVSLTVTKDKMKGWNIFLVTTNFRFTPENVNKAHRDGEGHAHLYINKQKTRIYSPWFHVMSLPKGNNTIRVTLNANNHAEYTVNGEVIEAMTVVTN